MYRTYLALSLVVLLSGCGGAGTSRITGSGTTHVGNTSADYYMSNGGMMLVIWIKHPPRVGHGSGSGISSSANKIVMTGNYRRDNGTPLEWRCETADGKSGSVTVGGANYELTKGGIFLVDMQEDKPVIIQLSRGTSSIKDKAELEALAATDPEIAKFVSEKKEVSDTKKESSELK